MENKDWSDKFLDGLSFIGDGIVYGYGKFKNLNTILGKYSITSGGGMNSNVEVFSGDMFTRVINNCPDPIVIKMSDEEILKEMDRVTSIINRITDANGFDRMGVIQGNGRDNLQAPGNNKIYANPLYTHLLSENELAFSVSHELAHNQNRHFGEDFMILHSSEEIDLKFGTKDKAMVCKAICKAHEIEADIIGAKIAMKAGYTPNDVRDGMGEFLNGVKMYEKGMQTYLNVMPYTVVEHPIPAIRYAMVDAALNNPELMDFYSPSHIVVPDKTKSSDLERHLAFEKEMVERILPILKAESEYYKKEIAKLPLLPKEERIHLSGYLTKLINEEKKYGINEKVLKENKRAASKGLDDKLSHRAALIEIAKDKERTFRGIAETVLSSITEQDKKELYEKKLQEIDRSRIRRDKVVIRLQGIEKLAKKAIASPFIISAKTIDTAIHTAFAMHRNTKIGKFIPDAVENLVNKVVPENEYIRFTKAPQTSKTTNRELNPYEKKFAEETFGKKPLDFSIKADIIYFSDRLAKGIAEKKEEIDKLLVDIVQRKPDRITSVVRSCYKSSYPEAMENKNEENLRTNIGCSYIMDRVKQLVNNKTLRIDINGRVIPSVREIKMDNSGSRERSRNNKSM